MNELNFEHQQSRFPAGVAMIVPGEQAERLEEALKAVTQVLSRYELADQLAKNDTSFGNRNPADTLCVAMLEANQDDLGKAVRDSASVIDRAYINEMADSYVAYQKGATLDYKILRHEAKLAIHAVSHIKDDVLQTIDTITSNIDVIQPFDAQTGLENETDPDFRL
ncbi:hypothetical protein [Pseudosulfitobacter pseudonitzschiae]|uniref:hypothetical protein n=1 Tax=Pseudosulfitobacter pseudonitzschiae TaxID=1402135 RepID=UPI003B76661A